MSKFSNDSKFVMKLGESLSDYGAHAYHIEKALTNVSEKLHLDGAFLSFGMQGVKEEAFEEVHRSNMSKLGADGKPIRRESDGKVMKGPDFFEPDLAQFIVNKDEAA